MKILILTQKIDRDDPILGFFHNWVLRLAEKFESVAVVCLQKGKFDLPKNVQVFSLGKEKSVVSSQYLVVRKVQYILNFYKFVWNERQNYDSVFVHMNQEYVLLGGFIWKIMGKKIYFWRNHPAGNLLTNIAVFFSEKVFYTAPNSYTARFAKSVKMPVGIDTEKFPTCPNDSVGRVSNFQFSNQKRQKNSILSLGRISPVKNVHIMVEAAKILKEKNIDFVFDIVGDPVNPEDFDYKNKLPTDFVNFMPAVSNDQTPEMYKNHEIFVNLTESFDKTIIEAAICGALPIIANKSLENEIDASLIAELSPKSVAERLGYWLKASEEEKERTRQKLAKYVLENHSLDTLIKKLYAEILR